MRAMKSVGPPAANGTTIRTGRLGQSVAACRRLTATYAGHKAAIWPQPDWLALQGRGTTQGTNAGGTAPQDAAFANAYSDGRVAVSPVGGPSIAVHPPSTDSELPVM